MALSTEKIIEELNELIRFDPTRSARTPPRLTTSKRSPFAID